MTWYSSVKLSQSLVSDCVGQLTETFKYVRYVSSEEAEGVRFMQDH